MLLEPDPNSVAVRMYRQGHGDCFLLAFREDDADAIVYVLIDCGLWNGSQIAEVKIDAVVADIAAATGKHLHLVVITHEHMDHVSGFRSAKEDFQDEGFVIDRVWLAWTEDPENELANKLREQYHDVLYGLAAGLETMRLGAADEADRISRLLSLEFGIDQSEAFGLDKIKGITNKTAMALIKEKAADRGGVEFLRPGDEPVVPGTKCKAYVLGPPESASALQDMNPRPGEDFHLIGFDAFAALAIDGYLAAAGAKDTSAAGLHRKVELGMPFAKQYRIPEAEVAASGFQEFFQTYYDGADERRKIKTDWAQMAESIALRIGDYVNNTSLVLAFELPRSKRVLLFVGDAQRGNWASWAKLKWKGGANGQTTLTDLLERTVLYKVGHHGSHNATLRPMLEEMARRSPYKQEFVALIPAHREWAANVQGWEHPNEEIEEAIKKKARGRVIVSGDDSPTRPDGVSASEWKKFKVERKADLYYQYTVYDRE